MNETNGNEFTCCICRDLIPLVKDGVASADSEAAVKRHIGNCSECAKIFDDGSIPEMPEASKNMPKKVLLRTKRWLTFVYAAVLLLGVFYAVRFSGSSEMFISWLIMPFIGVFGYLAFRWRTAFILPPFLLIPLILMNENVLLNDGRRVADAELLEWAIFYYLLALAAMIITALLRFAFGKTSLPDLEVRSENDER